MNSVFPPKQFHPGPFQSLHLTPLPSGTACWLALHTALPQPGPRPHPAPRPATPYPPPPIVLADFEPIVRMMPQQVEPSPIHLWLPPARWKVHQFAVVADPAALPKVPDQIASAYQRFHDASALCLLGAEESQSAFAPPLKYLPGAVGWPLFPPAFAPLHASAL